MFVLQGGLRAWSEGGGRLESGAVRDEPLGFEAAKRRARSIDARRSGTKIRAIPSTLVLDVGTSLEFEAAHVPGAKWISRGWIDLKLPQKFPDRTQPIVVTCPDGQQSVFAAQTLRRSAIRMLSVIGRRRARMVCGGIANGTGTRRLLGRSPTTWSCRRRFAATRKTCSVIWIGKRTCANSDQQRQQLSYFGLAKVLAALVATSKRRRGMSVRSLP